MRNILVVLFLTFTTGIAFGQYSNETIKTNQQLPDIILKDTAGKEMKLSAQINKSVALIDFWASWCGPCRRANPSLVKLYNDFKNKKFKGAKKGFKVISISLDQESASWKKAIAADQLAWPYHMSDLKGWHSLAASIFGVQYIPQCFLVDGSGKVIGTYMFAEQARGDIEKLLK